LKGPGIGGDCEGGGEAHGRIHDVRKINVQTKGRERPEDRHGLV